MLYAILAYHEEHIVQSWSPDEDAALMDELLDVHDGLVAEGRLGPAARLGATADAVTLRGPGPGVVLDGPFAETKEQLLGFYILEGDSLEEVIEAAKRIKEGESCTFEIRPIQIFKKGVISEESLTAS